MKLSREVKTAILVILGIVFLIFGINYLKGKNLLESSKTFYTEFDYNALTTASPITIMGNNVGRINSITYVIETGKTRVSFSVNNDLKFSKNSKIRLYPLGILDGNGLAIIPADDSQFAENGDVLQSEVEQGLIKELSDNFSGIGTDLGSTLKSADSLLLSLNGLVEDDSEVGLKHAIKELNATLSSFKILSGSFNTLIAKNQDSLAAVISNFNTVSKNLSVLSEDLKDVELSKTISKLDETLSNVNSLLAQLDNGEGSLGKLLKEDDLYNNLEGASKELEMLLEDVKLHPKRYFRILSKKEIPYEEPEN